jgi:hypothetical protein
MVKQESPLPPARGKKKIMPNPRPSDYVKCSPVRILDRLDIAYADPQAKLDDVIVRALQSAQPALYRPYPFAVLHFLPFAIFDT